MNIETLDNISAKCADAEYAVFQLYEALHYYDDKKADIVGDMHNTLCNMVDGFNRFANLAKSGEACE